MINDYDKLVMLAAIIKSNLLRCVFRRMPDLRQLDSSYPEACTATLQKRLGTKLAKL